MRVAESARRHGVAEEDILHAVRNTIRQAPGTDEMPLLIGPATNGALLEIGVLDLEGEDPVVVHAMPLRPKFQMR